MKSLTSMLFLLLIGLSASAGPLYRPSQEYRSMNTASYQISVQKNGRVSVSLTSGAPVFDNAFPMIWFDGKPAPQPLPVRGRNSVRAEVHDRLGRGNGMVLGMGGCAWEINTYETQPFFTVRVSFVNTQKNPVKVKMLLPWCVADSGKGQFTLGGNTEQSLFLENEQGIYSDKRIPSVVSGDVLSTWNLAAFNPTTGRSLIGGFLTTISSFPQVRVERGPKAVANAMGVFQAECVYDPPMEVAPGARLESEWLYVSINETNPLEGLERYADAVSRVNQIQHTSAFLPHGWDSWSTKYRTDINEERLLTELEVVDRQLKRYGWTHFAIDDGWALERGDWEPNPERFPHGMKWMADQIHARGMTAGLWIAPFSVSAKSAFAQAHPDWLCSPNELGKQIVGQGEFILDITAPGAYDYVKGLCAKITKEWGYDALVEADFVYYLLFMDKYHESRMTRAEVMRMGMRAIREGVGDDKFVMSFPPGPTNGPYVDGMRIGDDCAPLWNKQADKWPWGCVETLGNAARRYYFAPYLWAPDQDCAFFGHEDTRKRWDVSAAPALTLNQSVAWLTGAALTGGVVKIGDAFTDLTPPELGVLRKLLPVPAVPARPIDLFQPGPPRIWSLPVQSAIGNWEVVGVFNWDAAAPQTVALNFASLGLNPADVYTVYDFWADKYYGTAQNTLSVTAGPGSVRLLGLKPYQGHPMFLSTDRHFTQGATDFRSLTWDDTTQRLTGVFDGVADTDYTLRVLVPDNYAVQGVSASAGPATTSQDGKVLSIAFHCSAQASVTWIVECTKKAGG